MSKAGYGNRRDGIPRSKMSVTVDDRFIAVLEKESAERGITLSALVESVLGHIIVEGVGNECPACGLTLGRGCPVTCKKPGCLVIGKHRK